MKSKVVCTPVLFLLQYKYFVSLELRRLRADLYLLYKIIFGMRDIDSNSLLSLRGDAVRGHRYKVIQEPVSYTHLTLPTKRIV